MVVVVVAVVVGRKLQYFKFSFALSLSVKILPPRRREGSAFHSRVSPFPFVNARLK